MLKKFKSRINKSLLVGALVLVAANLSFSSHLQASDSTNIFKAHSLKKLDVAGSEMILLQLFLKKRDLKVISKDDHIGVSQKNDLVSFYMDYEKAHPSIKEILSKKSYIRSADKLDKLLAHVFTYKQLVNDSDEVLSIKMNP